MFKYFFVFILLISSVLAVQLWSFQSFGPIEAKPVFFDDKIVLASYDGNVYCLYAENGNLFWKTEINEKIKEIALTKKQIILASNNKILILDKNRGELNRTIEEEYIYGIETTEEFIYMTTKKGLKAYTYEGNKEWVLKQENTTLTEPLLANNRLFFGADENLIVVLLNGSIEKKITTGPLWGSKPAFYNDMVFVGSTDANLYAINLSKNKTVWSFRTNAWIMSNPIYKEGIVYFGSNDRNIYALNSTTGELKWSRKTQEAVQGNFEIFSLENEKRQVLIAGSNDNNVYVLDAKDGSIVHVFLTKGWVHNPTFVSETIYFGSYDNSFYAYSFDRGCTILTPLSGEKVGYMPFNISGRAFSKTLPLRVSVRLNNKNWNSAFLTTETSNIKTWFYTVDPAEYEFGQIFIECKVSDGAGEEVENFNYVLIFRDKHAVKNKMKITLPASTVANKAFTIKAYTETGAPLENFNVLIGSKVYVAKNGQVTVNISNPNTYDILITKTGYEDERRTINVEYDLVLVITAIITAIGVIAIAFYLFVYKKK